jgi:alpha-1,4-digalacturonate transport system substrate-binding protein
MRVPGGEDKGLYGYPTQFTVTGGFINATAFALAGVEIPTGETTFSEWVALAEQVATATNTPYAVSIDRSLHRMLGPVFSLGGTWVDKETGKITIDTPAMREFAGMLVDWHTRQITPQNVWIAAGDKYASARDSFVNGELVFYFSGSWQIGGFAKDIGDKFEWQAIDGIPQQRGCAGRILGQDFVLARPLGANQERRRF